MNHLRNVKQPIELTYNEDGTIQPVDAYLGDSIAADAHAKRRSRSLPLRRLPTELGTLPIS